MGLDQMGDAMGEGTGFATASTSHHQQGAFMVIDCPALGVIKSGQKAHGLMVREFSGLGDGQHRQTTSMDIVLIRNAEHLTCFTSETAHIDGFVRAGTFSKPTTSQQLVHLKIGYS